MRTTLNLDDDAALAARNLAQRQRVSLGKAVSELVRRGAAAGGTPMPEKSAAMALRGRYALLPARDEIITPQQVRDLMEREGI
jgi:hypothetical protein